MVELIDGEEYHSIGEFSAVLSDENSAALWAKLGKAARFLSAYSRWPDDGDALLQEAICRVLEGRRPWPKREEIASFLVGVMRSLASDRPKIGFRQGKDTNLDAATTVPSNAESADATLHEKQVKAHLLELFEGHEDQALIVEGRFDGMSKQDFLVLFDQDETRYQTACKGIRRKLAQHPDLKGLIHGE